MFGGIVVDEIHLNFRVQIAVAAKQVRQESRGDRGVDADLDPAMFRPPDRCDVVHAVADTPQYLAGAPQEALSREGQAYAAAMTMEQRRAQVMLEIPDAPAEGGLVNADGGSRLAKAAILGRCNKVAEMPKLHRVRQQLRHGHNLGCTEASSHIRRMSSSAAERTASLRARTRRQPGSLGRRDRTAYFRRRSSALSRRTANRFGGTPLANNTT